MAVKSSTIFHPKQGKRVRLDTRSKNLFVYKTKGDSRRSKATKKEGTK